MTNMCVGELRRVIVPPELGFGGKKFGTLVPAHSFLDFEIELLQAFGVPSEHNTWREMNEFSNNDNKLTLEEYKKFIQSTENPPSDEAIELTFQNDDMNGDGFVTWDEFPRPKGAVP
eukprot:c27976_g1_i1.p1 GENE.c27976_g1_i1~~c27976_g1_i1.p1  ORF type:complete len:117 (+),score=33.65 c27976_g1_i1:98-448(+)